MNVYEARHAGREYCCDTEGSDHYKEGGVEPIDLMIAKGIIEDFCIGNMVKYATRFKITRNLVDLKKVSDYAHILCGIELNKPAAGNPVTPDTEDKPVEPWGEEDDERQNQLLCGIELNKPAAGNPVTPDTEDKPVEPWGEEDDERQNQLLCDVGRCNSSCVFKKKANANELESCVLWCEAHPAEARKIMDEMEVSK